MDGLQERQEITMALTKKYRETVVARIKKDPAFTAALYAEAISSLVEGDKATALSIFRDLVHSHISFKKLAQQMDMDEKSLHRMLGSGGNPTMENLVHLMHVVENDLNLSIQVDAKIKGKNPALRKNCIQHELAYA